MSKRTRSTRGGTLGAAAALLLALTPAAALADHRAPARSTWGWGHDAHHAGDHEARRPRHRVRHHGARCDRHGGQARHQYGCRPCGRHFASLRGLRAHVHHHHHVPFWKLPLVIVASSVGLFFHG